MWHACYAKINLYLRVVGRRPDGFHELETVFQTINLADKLQWEAKPSPITLRVVHGPDFGADNLVLRAVEAYAEKAAVRPQGKITLEKTIPIGGGLGGGSSNAAKMLELLNRHYQLLSKPELQEIALALGSDVPFFLEGGCLWGHGRGELLQPCEWNLPVRCGFLFLPPFGIPTGAVFKKLQARSLGLGAVSYQTPEKVQLGRNDLEAPACSVNPKLRELLKGLRESLPGELIFMSGSGSTLVWLTQEEHLPKKIERLLEQTQTTPMPFSFI